MSKILIIGGGFSGLACAKRVAQARPRPEVALLDRKETVDFLPMLPDCIGRGIHPEYLSYGIEDAARKYGFKFIKEEVTAVNLENREVLTPGSRLSYDYLIIASGSETNFYGNEVIRKYAYKIDDGADIKKIIDALRKEAYANFIIGGGGYTGIEAATNLGSFLEKNKRSGRIIIVERTPSILGPLPAWMKDYAAGNLKKLEVEVLLNSTIENIELDKVFLNAGRTVRDAMVIWAAGVKTAGFIQNLNAQKNPQGRLAVDEFLRLNSSCFVAGDAAYFSWAGAYLRMAVQFAIAQGECAGLNVINSIKAKALKKFRPLDLGYIIPMANNRSCGQVLGINLRGILPTLLHFIMCIYRSYGLKNKLGIIRDLSRGGG